MITTTEKTTIVTDDWRTMTERLAVASHHMYSRKRCVFILKIVYVSRTGSVKRTQSTLLITLELGDSCSGSQFVVILCPERSPAMITYSSKFSRVKGKQNGEVKKRLRKYFVINYFIPRETHKMIRVKKKKKIQMKNCNFNFDWKWSWWSTENTILAVNVDTRVKKILGNDDSFNIITFGRTIEITRRLYETNWPKRAYTWKIYYYSLEQAIDAKSPHAEIIYPANTPRQNCFLGCERRPLSQTTG